MIHVGPTQGGAIDGPNDYHPRVLGSYSIDSARSRLRFLVCRQPDDSIREVVDGHKKHMTFSTIIINGRDVSVISTVSSLRRKMSFES